MKKVTTSLLLSAMVLVPMTGVLAAEDTGAKTNASVTLKKADTSKPIDPVDPGTDKEDPDDKDKGTGNTGSLRIDGAPNFVFGEMELGKGVVTTSNTRLNSSLQISDLQEKRTGWKVTAKASELENENGVTLSGALVELTPGNYVNYAEKDGKYESKEIELEGMKELKGTKVNISKEAAPVFSANAHEGGGTWVERFVGENAQLTFDSNKSETGTYTGTVTWEISSNITDGAK